MLQPIVFVGIIIGAMLPFLFCSFSMKAVGKAAGYIVEEVPPPVQGDPRPDGGDCRT